MLKDIWDVFIKSKYKLALKQATHLLIDTEGLDALHIAGLSLMRDRRADDGIVMLKAATLFYPSSAHIYANAALECEQAGRIEEMIWFADLGRKFFPDNADLLLLRANAHMMKMEFSGAELLYQRILKKNPKHLQSMINLGNIARCNDDFDSAHNFFSRVEAIDPDFRDIAFAKATMYAQMGENAKAREMLEPRADESDAQFLLALLDLADGNYERGFRLHRNRGKAVWFRTSNLCSPIAPMDHWKEAVGKRVALIQEGGLGDGIMFARFVPQLAEVAHVTIYAYKALDRLYRLLLPDNVTILPTEDATEREFDYITTDVELAYHFRTTFETIPPVLPTPPFTKTPRTRPKVGLCWSGGVRANLNLRPYDERRSIPLVLLAPLLDIDCEFVSLQLKENPGDDRFDLVRPLKPGFDLLDTAGVAQDLDLVISVDTSVVHLTASFGIPTWILSRKDCCWRWHNNAETSPWYPDVVRVFGQREYRQWAEPIENVRIALAEWRENW